MKYSNITKLIGLLVLFLVAFMFGCTERGLDSSQYPIRVQMDPGFGTAEMAEMINLVCLTVSGRDMEPVTVCQPYVGGLLTFEVNVPAGQDRLFVLQGISQLADGERTVIYEGSALADIEADASVELSIPVVPVVPLIRFTPFQSVVNSGNAFQVNVEAFNLPALLTTELRFLYDLYLLTVDSITKGATLGISDYIEIQVGSNVPGFQVIIGDSDPSGTIVDANGYSHLATLWFHSGVTVDSVRTLLEAELLSFATNDGTTIVPEQVYSQLAAVIIRSYTAPAMRLTPALVEVASGYEFFLDVELFNFTNLKEVEFNISFNSTYLMIDSVSKGTTLDDFDGLTAILGDVSVPYVRVTDTSASGLIIDADGYSHLARLWFSTNVTVSPAEVLVLTPPDHFYLLGGDSIPVATVPAREALIVISAFQDSPISFDDPALEQVVRDVILDYTSEQLYLSQVWWVTYLNASDRGIQSLGGIEALQNLEYADLSYNIITNISPLADLPVLLSLTLDGNVSGGVGTITDFTPLASITRLEYLSLQETDIANLAPITGLSRLQYLILKHNSITTLPADLSGLTSLEYLDLSNLIDWPGGNNITNITPLSVLTGLTTLNLSWNYSLSNIAPLSSLTNLNYLYLEYMAISELGPLSPLISLSILDLDGNNITDVQALVNNSGLGSGDYLYIQYNPLSATACYDLTLGLPALVTRGVMVSADCAM